MDTAIKRKAVVVYTHNHWFYYGIKSYLIDYDVTHYQDGLVDNGQAILILADSQILLNGDSQEFNAFICANNVERIIWLVSGETGMIYPLWSKGDRVLDVKRRKTKSFNQLIRKMSEKDPELKLYHEGLTVTEDLVMDHLEKGFDISQIAMLTGKNEKTVYQHRSSITRKFGFKNNTFLQYIFMRNGGMMWEKRKHSLHNIIDL